MKVKKIFSAFMVCLLFCGSVGVNNFQKNTAFAAPKREVFPVVADEIWGESDLHNLLPEIDSVCYIQGADKVREIIELCIEKNRTLRITRFMWQELYEAR